MSRRPHGDTATRAHDARPAWRALLEHGPAMAAPALAAGGVLLALWATGGTGAAAEPRGPALALAAPLWAAWLLACAALALLAWLARPILPRRRRRGPVDDEPSEVLPRKLSPAALLVLLALLLVPPAAVMVFMVQHPWLGLTAQRAPASTARAPARRPPGVSMRIATATPAPSRPPVSTWVIAAPAVTAGLLLALVLWAWLRHHRRPRRAGPEATPARRADEAGGTLPDPHGIADPRLTVALCYRHLEHLLEERDCPRRPWMTAAELARAALVRLPCLPPRALHELTALLEEARFSDHVMSARARDTALRALAGIRTAIHAREHGDGGHA